MVDRHPDVVIRSMIQHENDLINSRMGWMITLQGLLFAALGASINRQSGENTFFLKLIPLIGLFSSLLTAWGIFTAQLAIARLQGWWEKHEEKLKVSNTPYEGPPIIGHTDIKNQKIRRILNRYITPWMLLPLVFIISWVTILIGLQ